MKEHDRLALARQMMERKLAGRRTSSKLPELIELVMAKPLVWAGMVVKTLDLTPTGGAADCWRTGPSRDDGQGEVSGVGCPLNPSTTHL